MIGWVNHAAATMKVYLDNNVVSAIAKDDTPTESEALALLLKAREQGKVDLVTSELTHTEIKRYQGQMRPEVDQTIQLLEQVPIVRWDALLGIHSYGNQRTWINAPMIQNDPLYTGLLALKLDPAPVDAQHVFVATKNGCDALLTCDRRVLNRSADIGQLCGGLVVQKPSDFVASQGW
jgi:predicted nucleic acid-binding protein